MMLSAIFVVIISVTVECNILFPHLEALLVQLRPNIVPSPRICECGHTLTRIIGGAEAVKNEFPWMVALCFGWPCKSQWHHCGGTLINRYYVLTAAHCVYKANASQLTVNLGDHDLNSINETFAEERKVANITIHQSYNPNTLVNDIALLRLSVPIEITDNVRPICMPTIARKEPTYVSEVATVIGWGSTNSQGSIYPSILRKVDVEVLSQSDCIKKYKGSATISDGMICAATTGKDSCYGDSGGPLSYKDPSGKHTIIGIVSFGIGCADSKYPGVYTRITKYLSWFDQNMDSNILLCA